MPPRRKAIPKKTATDVGDSAGLASAADKQLSLTPSEGPQLVKRVKRRNLPRGSPDPAGTRALTRSATRELEAQASAPSRSPSLAPDPSLSPVPPPENDDTRSSSVETVGSKSRKAKTPDPVQDEDEEIVLVVPLRKTPASSIAAAQKSTPQPTPIEIDSSIDDEQSAVPEEPGYSERSQQVDQLEDEDDEEESSEDDFEVERVVPSIARRVSVSTLKGLFVKRNGRQDVVQSNGGILVAKESHADYIVLDNRFPSYASSLERYEDRFPSHKLVTYVWLLDCFRTKTRLSPSSYPCPSPPNPPPDPSSRPTLTSIPAASLVAAGPVVGQFRAAVPRPLPRKGFTDKDKNDLAMFILRDRKRCERWNEVQYVGGMALYERMESKVPGKTAQSWKSHYQRNRADIEARIDRLLSTASTRDLTPSDEDFDEEEQIDDEDDDEDEADEAAARLDAVLDQVSEVGSDLPEVEEGIMPRQKAPPAPTQSSRPQPTAAQSTSQPKQPTENQPITAEKLPSLGTKLSRSFPDGTLNIHKATDLLFICQSYRLALSFAQHLFPPGYSVSLDSPKSLAARRDDFLRFNGQGVWTPQQDAVAMQWLKTTKESRKKLKEEKTGEGATADVPTRMDFLCEVGAEHGQPRFPFDVEFMS